MPTDSQQVADTSLTSRLEGAVDELDRKLGSLNEWMERAEANLGDFEFRWQLCSENLSAQMLQVERELAHEPAGPRLRVF